MILTLQTDGTSTIDIIYDWLLIQLSSVSQLTYANHAACAIEAIQEFIFHLAPAIDGLGQQIGIPVECDALQSPDELFH